MTHKTRAEILVITGDQAGANTILSENEVLSISGTLDTDIVIMDKAITEEKIEVKSDNEDIYVKVVSGEIEIDGKSIGKNINHRVNKEARVKIGETIFLCRNTSSSNQENNSSQTSSELKIDNNQVASKKDKRNYIGVYSSILLLTLITTVAIVVINKEVKDEIVSSITDSNSIKQLLKDNGYESLRVEKKGGDQYSISGFVLKNNERADIENIIDRKSVPAVLNLEVGEQLAMEVRELYRINGVDATTKTVKEGSVSVMVEDTNREKIEHIKNIALREIATLKELSFEYKNAESNIEIIEPDITYSEADKRITMVVDGDPAYIMTSDQAKYYIGALLPTGYKIVDIIQQQVVLERKGKTTTLNF